MKLLDYIKHFNSCFRKHLIPFLLSLGLNIIFNTLWQVCHHKEIPRIKWPVQIVCRNVNFDAFLLSYFLQKKGLFEVGSFCGGIKLHRHKFWIQLWSIFLRQALVEAHDSLATWVKLFDEQELSILEINWKAFLVYVAVISIHFLPKNK